jgi:MFS family permease
LHAGFFESQGRLGRRRQYAVKDNGGVPSEPTAPSDRAGRLAEYFALNRNIAAASGTVFLMSLGENLWRKFLPKYLESLGAPIAAIGLFGTCEDFLDGVYQYPGGWVGDHLGRRSALVLFVGIASAGYLTYWLAPTWPWIFLGLVFAMAWSSMASPTLFSIIGDALPSRQRAMGFTVQSVLKRVPIIAAPTLGGMLIAVYGLRGGVRLALLFTLGLAAITALCCAFIDIGRIPDPDRTRIVGVWRSLPSELRRLLLSDIFIRTCDAMVDVFLVLYTTNVIGIAAPQFGVLVAVQAFTAMTTYVPAARFAAVFGRKPFVVATFVFFALFPIAIVLSTNFITLIAAFIVGGLREVGEPARKAMILDMVQPALRGRSVGLYYLIRSLAISPAAFVGGLFWHVSPAVPFIIAGLMGGIGTVVFAVTVDERYAS